MTSPNSRATVAERIRNLREQARLSPKEMASRIWMNVPSYYDLEAVPEEWEGAVDLSQLLELSRIFRTPLLELLGEPETEIGSPLSFPELAAFIRRHIAEGRVEEDRIGWDLSEFWEEPMIAMEYPVSFLKVVGEDVGFDWRRPLLFYQRAAEPAASPNDGSKEPLGNLGLTGGPASREVNLRPPCTPDMPPDSPTNSTWPEEISAIEKLDWRNRPEEFDRLCAFIIRVFAERDGVSRDRLFSALSEEEFRRHVRHSAERFTDKFRSLFMFVYLRMKLLVLPDAVREKKRKSES